MNKIVRVFKNAFASGRPFRYLLRPFLVRSGLCALITQKRRGYSLKFFPTMINGALFFHGSGFYSHEEDLVRSLLREGDCMVDVGCNVGLLSLSAMQVLGRDAKCFAFEANPRIAAYARAN